MNIDIKNKYYLKLCKMDCFFFLLVIFSIAMEELMYDQVCIHLYREEVED